jgi:hypothetical protein
LFSYGCEVIDGQGIGGGVGDSLRPAFIFGINLIRADALDEIQDILLAGEANGDYQNQGSSPNHHA